MNTDLHGLGETSQSCRSHARGTAAFIRVYPYPSVVSLLLTLALLSYSCGRFAPCAMADEPSTFLLLTNAQVASDGVFLTQVVTSEPPLPRLRLADAPEF